MKKIVCGIAIIITFILISIIVFVTYKKYNQIQNDNYHQQEINEYYIHDGWLEIGYELAKKDNDWSKLPISKKFRKKYNSKDGILGNVEFDIIEYRPFANTDKNWYFKDYYTYFVITKGKKKVAYHYDVVHENGYGNWIDDIVILEKFEIVDELGNEKEIKRPFTENTKRENINFLVRGGIEESGVAVTDKFHKKYPFFLDLFIHYSPRSYNKIEFLEKESDLDNNIAIFEVNSILECKRRKYEVKLIFDDKMYLDDAEVKLVKEEEYRGDNSERINKITYQNSNWDNLKLTDNFRKKYNSENGIIDDINNINIDIDVDEVTLEMNRKYVTCFTYKNGDKISYLFEYLEDQDGKLDNVLCEKLPYINKTAAEVKELYLKSIVNNDT